MADHPQTSRLGAQARLAVFAPSPLLTVTIERGGSSQDEVHVHAGGQGVWVAHMAVVLGAEVTLCAPLGGETGRVLQALIESDGIRLRAIPTGAWNGSYVHDRRAGERALVARVPSPRLQRHELDALYGAMIAAALSTKVAALTGPENEGVLPGEHYRRLAADLRRNHVTVIADLTGEALDGALAGGVDVLKLSHEELRELTVEPLDSTERFAVAMERLERRGARCVLISRADQPALASVQGSLLDFPGPRFEPFDRHGAGDSMVAGLAVGIGRGLPLPDALRLAVAAGTLNVTRRGLGSGQRPDIERLAKNVHPRAVTAVRTPPSSGVESVDSDLGA
jgi:1-phosphofructokinase